MNREGNYFTNYWLDSIDRNLVMSNDIESSTSDLIYKMKLKRGVDNFVRALSKRDIPVKFMDRWDTAATDFKTIFIPGNISAKNFDIVIGLALHETSHNMYSVPFLDAKEFADYLKINQEKLYKHLTKKYRSENDTTYNFESTLKQTYYKNVFFPILNIIEDRRIDNLVFQVAPGYRGYYQSLYNKYFINRGINDAIKKNKFSKETWDCYIFHLTNFVNPNRKLDTLKYLRWLWNKVDLKNINRLKSSQDVTDLVFEIIEFLETNTIPVEPIVDQDKKQNSGKSNKDGINQNDQSDEVGTNQNDQSNKDGIDQNNQTIDQNKNFKSDESNKDYNNAKNLIVRDYEKVQGLSIMCETSIRKIDILEQSKTTELEIKVDGDKVKVFEYFVPKNNKTVAVPGINSSELMRDEYQRGYNIGKRLAKKLLVRNDDHTVVYSRLKRGNIDQRLIAEIGYGNEKIMKRAITTTSNPSFIHISIDNSGSMKGRKIQESIVTATAIAVACYITGSIDVQISLRSTTQASLKRTGTGEIFITYIYDSRVHDLNHLKFYMSRIKCTSTTPEGLVFGSILNQLNKIPNGIDKYFINISDGLPQCYGMHSWSIVEYTKKMVGAIRKSNTKILSYMIQSKTEKFKEMYGKSAEYIDESNIFDIAKTINKQLLQSK